MNRWTYVYLWQQKSYIETAGIMQVLFPPQHTSWTKSLFPSATYVRSLLLRPLWGRVGICVGRSGRRYRSPTAASSSAVRYTHVANRSEPTTFCTTNPTSPSSSSRRRITKKPSGRGCSRRSNTPRYYRYPSSSPATATASFLKI